ncbi:MAG: glycosyltransferase family 4 protein [Gammaproteobacteria bacterium]|nr:glycosyltransferase family 4 protein [Gammaproteobacteria bacterium]
MKIVNVMFGKGLGGIEQAFVDYTEALLQHDHAVHAFAAPDAACINQLKLLDVDVSLIGNRGQWDPVCVYKLKQKMKALNPDVVIAHGNRAICLLRKAVSGIPLIGVAHNYNFKHIVSCDAILSITHEIKKQLIEKGFDKDLIHIIPNCIRVDRNVVAIDKVANDIPVVGAMGRFVEKKGFESFLRALAILKQRSIECHALIGGDGNEGEHLKNLAHELLIDDRVSFTGWVDDKEAFFKRCDIFCIPSLHEPFGIIVLEAFASSTPLVVTDSEGPSEIVTHNQDALVVEKGGFIGMADAIESLMKDDDLMKRLSTHGRQVAIEQYSLPVVSVRLNQALMEITQ